MRQAPQFSIAHSICTRKLASLNVICAFPQQNSDNEASYPFIPVIHACSKRFSATLK